MIVTKDYIFKNNENKIIWRTNTLPIVSANSVMLLTGTVAAHETYRNEKSYSFLQDVLYKVTIKILLFKNFL